MGLDLSVGRTIIIVLSSTFLEFMSKTSVSVVIGLTAWFAVGGTSVWSATAPNPIEDTPLIDKVTMYEGPVSGEPSDEDAPVSLTSAMPEKFRHATLDDKVPLSEWMERAQSPAKPKPDAETQALAPVAGQLPTQP